MYQDANSAFPVTIAAVENKCAWTAHLNLNPLLHTEALIDQIVGIIGEYTLKFPFKYRLKVFHRCVNSSLIFIRADCILKRIGGKVDLLIL